MWKNKWWEREKQIKKEKRQRTKRKSYTEYINFSEKKLFLLWKKKLRIFLVIFFVHFAFSSLITSHKKDRKSRKKSTMNIYKICQLTFTRRLRSVKKEQREIHLVSQLNNEKKNFYFSQQTKSNFFFVFFCFLFL